MTAFMWICIVAIFIIYIEKISKSAKDDYNKHKEDIKNSMIIKICTCNRYCTCKEEFIDYMDKNNIHILK